MVACDPACTVAKDGAPPLLPLCASKRVVGELHSECAVPCQDYCVAADVVLAAGDGCVRRAFVYAVLDGHGPQGDDVALLAGQALLDGVAGRLAGEYRGDRAAEERHAEVLAAAFGAAADVVDAAAVGVASGTTASLVVVEERTLTVANVGDSNVVLAREAGHNAQIVSAVHRPDDEMESQRVRDAGGIVQNGYVCDADPPKKMISVTRAFGDMDVRAIGVVPIPEIASYALKDDDEFVILATDGLWDAHGGVSPQRAVDAVRFCIDRDGLVKGVASAAAELIDVARGRSRYPLDDATVSVVSLRQPHSQTAD